MERQKAKEGPLAGDTDAGRNTAQDYQCCETTQDLVVTTWQTEQRRERVKEGKVSYQLRNPAQDVWSTALANHRIAIRPDCYWRTGKWGGGAEIVRDTARSTATQRGDGDGRLAMNSKANQHLRGKNRQRKPRESALVCRGSYYIRVNVRVCALSPSGNTAAVAPSMAAGQCK